MGILKKEDISVWTDAINNVVCMDSLDLLKMIPDKSIDLVLTDPPYNASNSNIGFKDGYKTINEEWDKDFKIEPFLEQCFRIIKDGGSIISFCTYHLLGDYLNFGKKVQQVIHWEHITAMPAIAKVYTPVIEYIVWYSTTNYTFNKEFSGRNVIRCKKPYQVGEKFEHPTVKPSDLIMKLLKVHSNENQTILDPFMGSWTTAVACQNLKRNFIGCELDEDYCKIGEERLRQKTLF